MKETIRQGVFETNSSSVHTLTMCSVKELEQWKKGEILFRPFPENFCPIDKIDPKEIYSKDLENDADYDDALRDTMYHDYSSYFDYVENCLEYESFEYKQTIEGVEVACFGYHGI